ncbi:MAG: hypothetical protein ACOH13_07960 [Flavobacteriales bacterium]
MWNLSFIRKSKSAVLPLAALLLFAAFAPKLSRMTCTSSGRSSINVGEAKDCCPGSEQPGSQLSSTCCEFTNVQAGIPTFTFDKVLATTPVHAVAIPWAAVIAVPLSGHAWTIKQQCRPPRLLSARLAELQVFRI